METESSHASSDQWRELQSFVQNVLAMRSAMKYRSGEAYMYFATDEVSPGTFVRRCLKQSVFGAFKRKPKRTGLDTQSGPFDGILESRSSSEPCAQPDDHSVPVRDNWSLLRNEAVDPNERIAAIQSLLETSPDTAVAYVAQELAQKDLHDEWRNVLVFLAEDIHFPASLRQQVGEYLLQIASQLRQSTKAGADKVVWSAMRRGFSLVPAELNRVLPFLERQGAVDTRSVALRCIERFFEQAPPIDLAIHKPVADRVAEFAWKMLDPDVFASGEIALIAQNAVCALAALGDTRLGDTLKAVSRLGRRWLNRQVQLRLQDLLDAWRATSNQNESHQAFKNIEQAIATVA